MAFEIYQKEQAAIEAAEALLREGRIAGPGAAEAFEPLPGDYRKLCTAIGRLVRMSDREMMAGETTATVIDELARVVEELRGGA